MTGTDMVLLGLTPRNPPNTHTHTHTDTHTQSWKTMNHFHLPVIHLGKSSLWEKDVPPPTAFKLLFKVYQTTHLKVKSHSRFWSDTQMQNKIPVKSVVRLLHIFIKEYTNMSYLLETWMRPCGFVWACNVKNRTSAMTFVKTSLTANLPQRNRHNNWQWSSRGALTDRTDEEIRVSFLMVENDNDNNDKNQQTNLEIYSVTEEQTCW